MKKLIVMLITFFMLLTTTTVFAEGTVGVTPDTYDKSGIATLTFSCVGDVSNGSIPDTTTTGIETNVFKEKYLYKVIVENDSGDTGVTDNSDVYILDSGGTDLLGGEGVDELDDDTRNVTILTAKHPVLGPITLDVDNQAVASGEYTVTLIFVPSL